MADAIAIGGSVIEPDWIVSDDEIRSISAELSSTLICDRMDYDVLTAEIHFAQPTSRSAVPTTVPYGTPVWWVHGTDFIGKFYAKNWTRTGPRDYTIEAVSAIGILDGIRHYGGIYTGQTVAEVLEDIIGDNFAYTVANDLAAVTVYGWLPIATARENLHQLLFAEGAQIVKDETGEMVFRYPDAETTVPIDTSRVYMGGSVNFGSPASGIDLTEHAFFVSDLDTEEILFDNTDGTAGAASDLLVTFDSPHHDLVATGSLTISYIGDNFAVISGIGTLSGRTYAHTTRVVSKEAGSQPAANIISVDEAYLVSAVNSNRVAERILSYYSSGRSITADIRLNAEIPGMQVSLINAFREPDGGFIAKMALQSSSIIKATCEIVSGYNPSGGGNNYNSMTILTGSGTWTPPAVGAPYRAILIGGGAGGAGGARGENGKQGSGGWGLGGAGGAPGDPGAGGKVYTFDGTFEDAAPIFFACGAGGAGGAAGAAGQIGTATTFGDKSSESGETATHGILNIFSGEVYATFGTEGIQGGDGVARLGEQTSLAYNGTIYYSGARGGTYGDLANNRVYAGGGGGGPAAGANGGDAPTPTSSRPNMDGGRGANAVAAGNGTTYGQGGQGGHGGGGGGGGGGLNISGYWRYDVAVGGAGGTGGKGGDGAPGCIVIYY